jgi:hypothetical protein
MPRTLKNADDKFSSKLIEGLDDWGQYFMKNRERKESTEFTFRVKNDEIIMDENVSAFLLNEDKYFLKEMTLFADDQIDCGEIVSFEKFKEKVSAGEICTKIPENAQVVLADMDPPLEFTARNVRNCLEESEFLKEICIAIDRLNNRPSAISKCMTAFKNFINDPTEFNREELRIAFEFMPRHMTMYLGNMDIKDALIRHIIYGDDKPTKFSPGSIYMQLGMEPYFSHNTKEEYDNRICENLRKNFGIIVKP